PAAGGDSRRPAPRYRRLRHARRLRWQLRAFRRAAGARSEEHTSELQSQSNIVCRLLLEKKDLLSSFSVRLLTPTDCPGRPPPRPGFLPSSWYFVLPAHRLFAALFAACFVEHPVDATFPV